MDDVALMDGCMELMVGMGYLANGSGGTPCMKNPLVVLAGYLKKKKSVHEEPAGGASGIP